MNLVGNAVKFTEAGGIRLGLELVRTEPKQASAEPAPAPEPGAIEAHEQALRLSVRDTGIGIPAPALAGLFEPFTQADASTTRRFGGTGLGLAICKRLVEAMGGEIGVESKAGRGSTFWFSLRLPVAPGAEARSAAAPAMAPARAAPVRVLVAEDNQVNRLLVLAMLQRKGFVVEAVTDGREAVEAARRDAFDVVLMDMQMPVLDGDGAAAAIRALPAPVNGLPIIALTAEALPEDKTRREGGGLFDAYLTKPIDWPRLVETVNALAARRRAERAGR
ncbi:ATP-binding protein [Aerophototrophica crusticola]